MISAEQKLREIEVVLKNARLRLSHDPSVLVLIDVLEAILEDKGKS